MLTVDRVSIVGMVVLLMLATLLTSNLASEASNNRRSQIKCTEPALRDILLNRPDFKADVDPCNRGRGGVKR